MNAYYAPTSYATTTNTTTTSSRRNIRKIEGKSSSNHKQPHHRKSLLCLVTAFCIYSLYDSIVALENIKNVNAIAYIAFDAASNAGAAASSSSTNTEAATAKADKAEHVLKESKQEAASGGANKEEGSAAEVGDGAAARGADKEKEEEEEEEHKHIDISAETKESKTEDVAEVTAKNEASATRNFPKKRVSNSNNQHQDEEKTDDVAPTATATVSFFDDSIESRCWLSMENATFMGCGEQGQTFLTTMYCANTSTTEETAIPTTTRKFVLKVSTTAPDDPMEYKGINFEKIPKSRRMYQTLFPSAPPSLHHRGDENHSNNDMRQHFYLTIGTVQIPVDKLYSTLNNNITQVNPKCAQIMHYHHHHHQQQQQRLPKEEELVLTGTICDVAKGKPLSDYLTNSQATATVASTTTTSNATTNTTMTISMVSHRRQIINQLICIWKHMYKHRFVHDDIRFDHIHLDIENNSNFNIGLIDFQVCDMLDDYNNNSKNQTQMLPNYTLSRHKFQFVVNIGNNNKIRILLQIMQQYQLMKLLANICMNATEYIPIPFNNNQNLNVNLRSLQRKGRDFDMVKYLPQMQLALKECDNAFINIDDDDSSDETPLFNNSSSLVRYGVVVNNKNIVSNAIPLLLSDHYQQVLLQNTSTFDDDYDDYDDVVVREIYDILSRWAGDGDSSGKC